MYHGMKKIVFSFQCVPVYSKRKIGGVITAEYVEEQL
jgi:hypothetical protein